MKNLFAFLFLMVFSFAIVAPTMAADVVLKAQVEQVAFDNDDDDPKTKTTKKSDKKGECEKKCAKSKKCDKDSASAKKCDKSKKASAEKKACCKKKEDKA